MSIPAFSIFSAVSEVFVTVGVLYGIVTTLKGKPFPKLALGLVLAFELCVNVVYMAGRASQADQSTTISQGMKIFYAFHGTLSLLMFVVLAVVYLLSLWDESSGRQNWFLRNRIGSYVMIFFWMVSVISGELIFYLAHFA